MALVEGGAELELVGDPGSTVDAANERLLADVSGRLVGLDDSEITLGAPYEVGVPGMKGGTPGGSVCPSGTAIV